VLYGCVYCVRFTASIRLYKGKKGHLGFKGINIRVSALKANLGEIARKYAMIYGDAGTMK
jgi:hypothetical protein